MAERDKIEISNGTGGSINVMCSYGDITKNCPVYIALRNDSKTLEFDDNKLTIRIHRNTDYITNLIDGAKKNCTKCNTGR